MSLCIRWCCRANIILTFLHSYPLHLKCKAFSYGPACSLRLSGRNGWQAQQALTGRRRRRCRQGHNRSRGSSPTCSTHEPPERVNVQSEESPSSGCLCPPPHWLAGPSVPATLEASEGESTSAGGADGVLSNLRLLSTLLAAAAPPPL